jgi:hypothetical protein
MKESNMNAANMRVISDIAYRLEFFQAAFWKLYPFPSSGVRGEGSYSLGSVRNDYSLSLNPDDRNRFSFRNIVTEKTPDGG